MKEALENIVIAGGTDISFIQIHMQCVLYWQKQS